jgi:pyridoxamine 5'-phosphate oxidase
VPDRYELWQHGADRLHDRLVYTRAEDGWELVRLAP